MLDKHAEYVLSFTIFCSYSAILELRVLDHFESYMNLILLIASSL